MKALKSHFKVSYDIQNLKLVVISYEIYETRQGPEAEESFIKFTWNDHPFSVFGRFMVINIIRPTFNFSYGIYYFLSLFQ